VAVYSNSYMNYEKQIIQACLNQKVPPLKIVAILNQARIESGNFSETKNNNSVWYLSNFTNCWGMMYPTTSLKWRKNIIGNFKSPSGKLWAKYKSVYNSTLDRLDWEKINGIIPFVNAQQYYGELSKRNYFLAQGIDKGYEKAVIDLYNKHLNKDLATINLLSKSQNIGIIISFAVALFFL